jgi:hypothetical protein
LLELNSDILNIDGTPHKVRVPDIDSILGDKLTAFAPSTIGVSLTAEPGFRPKRVEALKQLYDIGNLFDLCENIENIHRTYLEVANREIKERALAIQTDDVLRDSLHYAYVISCGGKIEKEQYTSIAKGHSEFSKFVADLHFDEQSAILVAAKVAYLTSTLLTNTDTLNKYDDSIDMTIWKITNKEYSIFNDYKFSNPEAFYYWYLVIERKQIIVE